MSIVRRLDDEEIREFTKIVVKAYPGFGVESKEKEENITERFIEIQEEDDTTTFYGLFREEELMGGMRIHDFTMNMYSQYIEVGGVGLIAVDLLHKKEKVCKEMIEYFLDYCKDKEKNIAILYPFRPSFYKKMGFGYGTKMSQYSFEPKDLPDRGDKEDIIYLGEDDKKRLADCYHRYCDDTHGMIKRSSHEIDRIFKQYKNKVIGFEKDGLIKGYMIFNFRKVSEDNFILNDMEIDELVYEDREALSQMMTFLYTQQDQINRIIFTTPDEYFHHILKDPISEQQELIPSVYHVSNRQGVGLMYKVIDVEGLFKELESHNFTDIDLKLKLNITDSFDTENTGEYFIDYGERKPSMIKDGPADVEISMDISEFSSLMMGVVNFRKLYEYNIVEIDKIDYMDKIDKLFKTKVKPRCMTSF